MKGKWKRTLALMLAVVIVFTSISFDSAASEPQAVEAENTQLTTATEEEAAGTEESGTPDVNEEENETPGTDEGEGENPGTNEGEGENPGTNEGEGETPGTNEGEGENPGTNEGEGENPGTNEGEEGQTPVEGEETETPVTEEEISVEAEEELIEESEMVLEEEEMVRVSDADKKKPTITPVQLGTALDGYPFRISWDGKSCEPINIKDISDKAFGGNVSGKGIKLREAVTTLDYYGMRYNNVGVYNGKALDLLVTVRDWSSDDYFEYNKDTKKESEPAVAFSTTSLDFFIKDISGVRFHFRLYERGTNTPVNVKGIFTFVDIDGHQELAFNRTHFAGETAYIQNGGNLKAGSGGGWNYVDVKAEKEKDHTENKDARAWVTTTFGSTGGGRSNFILWFKDKKVNRVGGKTFVVFGLRADAVVSTPLEQPFKSCDKTEPGNAFDVSEFTYTIAQKMPPRSGDTLTSYVLTDQLDSCLHISDDDVGKIKVFAGTTDVTSRFSISVTPNASGKSTITIRANANALAQASFYDTTYYFKIPVKIKDGADIYKDGHVDLKTHTFQIPNTATVNYNSAHFPNQEITTNRVIIKRKLPECSFLKVDENGDPITYNAATFTIYSDSECKKQIGTASYDAATGRYTLPVAIWGKIAVDSNLTYYMKETKTPDGYIPDVANALFTITAQAKNEGITISGGNFANGRIVNIEEQPLTITKTGSNPKYVAKGDKIQYTITVTNPNPVAYIVNIRDMLDSKVTAGDFTVNGIAKGKWDGIYSDTLYGNGRQLKIVIDATVNSAYNSDYVNSNSDEDRQSNIISNIASLSYINYANEPKSSETNVVEHYLQPRMDYTIKKERTTPLPNNRNGWGFVPNDGNIVYRVTLENTYRDIPLNMTVTDNFDNPSYFAFSGSNTQNVSSLTSSRTVFFYAKVNEGTPGRIGNGYRNVVEATGVWANYRDPRTKTIRQLAGTNQQAVAYTPVAPVLYKYDSVTKKPIKVSENQPVFKLYTNQACSMTQTNFVYCTYEDTTGRIFLPIMANAQARTYYLKETTAPEGYNQSNIIYKVTIASDNTVSVTRTDGKAFDGKVYNTPKQEPTITKTTRTDEYVKKGQEIIYDLIVTNANDEPYPVTVKDTLDNTKLQAGSYCIDDGASKGTWGGSTKVTVPANGSTKITIYATVTADYDVAYSSNATSTNREKNIIRNKASMTYTYNGASKTAETAEVLHYLEPTVSYTLTKTRTTKPSSTWGFFPGDGTQISYNATVINTSTVPINVTLEDEFADSNYFSFSNSSTTAVNGLSAGSSAVRTFQATVKKGTPAKVELEKNSSTRSGYKNTVTAYASATYRDAKSGFMKSTSAVEKKAVAYTPVAPELYKYDSTTKTPVSGVPVFEVYEDSNCTQALGTCTFGQEGRLILPDMSKVVSNNYTGYLKETQAPAGYTLNTKVYQIKIASSTGSVTISDAADGIIYNTREDGVMSIEKTGGLLGVVKKGDFIYYTITVKNHSRTTSYYAIVTDPIPDGLRVDWCNEGEVTDGVWKVTNTFQANSSQTYYIRAEVLKDYDNTGTDAEKVTKNQFRNQAFLEYFSDHYRKLATQIIVHYLKPEADFTITKERATKDPERNFWGYIREDGEIQYDVTLKNTGDLPLTVDVEDVFAKDGIFEFTRGSHQTVELPVGATKTVSFYAKVSENAKGSLDAYINTATAHATASYIDPGSGSNTTMVLEKSATAETKVAPYFYKYESWFNRPLTFTDASATTPQFYVYTDPECTSLMSFGDLGTSYDIKTAKVFLPNSPYGGNLYLKGTDYYLKEVRAAEGYHLSNKVYKFRFDSESGEFNITDAEGKDIERKIYNDLIVPTITKTCDTDGQYVKKGDIITYQITVTNPGNKYAQIFNLTDELDPRLELVESDLGESGMIDFNLDAGETRTFTIKARVKVPFDPDYKYDPDGNAKANTITNQAYMNCYYNGKMNTIYTETIKHYLIPEISYEVKKERVTAPTSTWGFLPGDGTEIVYHATVKNTGEIPIDVELSDAFEEPGNFTFTEADRAVVSNIAPDGTGTATFKATVNEGTKSNVTGMTDMKLETAGYKNIVTATASAEYRDAKDRTLKTVKAEPKEATARTPVAPVLYKYDQMTDMPLATDEGDVPVFTLYNDPDCTSIIATCDYDSQTGRILLPEEYRIVQFLSGSELYNTVYLKETYTPYGFYENNIVYRLYRNEKGNVIVFNQNDEPIDRIYNEPLYYDVEIIKDRSNPEYVQKGDTITYTLTVINTQGGDVKVKVTDELDKRLKAGKWFIDGREQPDPWYGNCNLTARAYSSTEIEIQAEVLQGYDASPTSKDELKAKNTIPNIAFLDIYRNNGEVENKKSEPVEHYLTPKTGLEVQKELATPTPNRPGGGYGFIPEDGEIVYNVTLKNTGEVPLTVSLEDVYEEDGIFEFVGPDVIENIELPVGETKVQTFTAKLTESAPGAFDPYINKVTARANGTYIDAKSGTERSVYEQEEAEAGTPVAAYFYKVDSRTDEPVINPATEPEFKVYSNQECTQEVAPGEPDAKDFLYDGATGRVYLPNGLFFNKTSGTYYIKETTAPTGYVKSDEVYTLTINEKGQYESITDSEGNDIGWRLKNTSEDSCFLDFVKVDADTEEPLSNAVFRLYKLNCTSKDHIHDTDIIDVDNTDVPGSEWTLVKEVTSSPGVYFEDLKWEGIYQLVEVTAPYGYLPSVGQWRITFDRQKNPVIQAIEKDGQMPLAFMEDEEGGLLLPNMPVPEFASTGGFGARMYHFGGLLLMALAVLWQALVGRKRKSSM